MFAASIDANTRPGPRLRPATKNALLVRTNRAVHRPIETTAREYTTRRMRWRLNQECISNYRDYLKRDGTVPRSRAAGRPPDDVASTAARTMASESASAAIA